MNPDITQLVEWIQKQVPALIRSGENWQAILHGRNDGTINIELKTTHQVISPKRQQRLDERSNGNVRQVRTPV